MHEGTVESHRLHKGAETSKVIFSWKRVRISCLGAYLQEKFASVIKLLWLHRYNSLLSHSCLGSAQAGTLHQSNHSSTLPYEHSQAICQLLHARWLPSEMLRTALLMVKKNPGVVPGLRQDTHSHQCPENKHFKSQVKLLP